MPPDPIRNCSRRIGREGCACVHHDKNQRQMQERKPKILCAEDHKSLGEAGKGHEDAKAEDHPESQRQLGQMPDGLWRRGELGM